MATDLTTETQRDSIINNALRRLHTVNSGATGNVNQIADAVHALALIVKRFDSDPRLKMFHDYTVKTVAVVANDASKALAAGVLTVEGAYYERTSDSTKTPLKPMTQREWIEAANEDSDTTGIPKFYYVSEDGDRAATVTMFFYPAVSADGTIHYWARDKIDLFDNATDTSDFPDSWTRLLVLQLTADLAWEYGKTLEEIQVHNQLAASEYQFLVEQQVQNTDYKKTDQPNDNSDREV